MKPIVDYKSLAPEGTFIANYMAMMEGQETPRAYDFWCAAWLLSLAMGRNMRVLRPRAPVFLNCYVVLCAEAGTTRKSTAVRIATTIARDLITPDWALIEGKTTPEKLEATLHEHSQLHGHANMAISISEMVTFFGREKYNMNMPGLLTDLYDCPDLRRGGSIMRPRELKDVYVSLITASTPSWLVRAINPDIIEGGFTSRCLFVVEERSKRRIAWPDEAAPAFTATALCGQLRELRTEASEIRARCGGIAISSEARDDFREWYERRDISREPFSSSFASREDHHVLRLAAYFAINERGWIIQCSHLKKAIRLIEATKQSAASLFAGTTSISSIALGIDLIRHTLANATTDGLTQSQLLHKSKRLLRAEQLSLLLSTMHELGMVQRFDAVAPSGRGRPLVIWRATTKILSRNATELLMQKIEPYAS